VSVSLVNPLALADDAAVAVVSTMGAPLVGEERLTDPEVAALTVQQMEEHLGLRFEAVMSLEIGGSNSFQSLMVVAVMGLPVVDADTMGRAYPVVQHTGGVLFFSGKVVDVARRTTEGFLRGTAQIDGLTSTAVTSSASTSRTSSRWDGWMKRSG